MLKKAVLVVTALTLSACASDKRPSAAELDRLASLASGQTVEAANGESAEAATSPEQSESATGSAESSEGSDTAPVQASVSCPELNGAFLLLNESGQAIDRITLATQKEGEKYLYSINNGEAYENGNKVYNVEQNGETGLVRLFCDESHVKLNYRNSSGDKKGLLSITALSAEKIKVEGTGEIATNGEYSLEK